MKKITLLLLLTTITAFTQTQQLDSFINQEFNEDTSTWEESWKNEFTYNSNNICTDEYVFEKEGSTWILLYESHYFLDANNNVIEIIYQVEGENTSKELLSYDSNENITEHQFLNWNGSQYVSNSKELHTYNSNELKIETITLFWSNSQWHESEKIIYQYSINNLKELVETFSYDNTTSQWFTQSSEKDSYLYNTDNKLIEVTDYSYNTTWVANEKIEYFYNENQDVSEYISSYWEDSSQTWVVEGDNICHYDNNFDFNDLILPYSMTVYNNTILFNHKLNQVDFYNEGLLNSKVNLFYSESTASINDVLTETINVFPNPFSNKLSFITLDQNSFKVHLFDIQGRKVLNQSSANNEQIDLSNLDNGIYFYEVISGSNKYKGKVIKK